VTFQQLVDQRLNLRAVPKSFDFTKRVPAEFTTQTLRCFVGLASDPAVDSSRESLQIGNG